MINTSGPETLFSTQVPRPLAYQLSPKTLEEYHGQTHLVGEGKPLRRLLDKDQLISAILWGPPGCGKTALARLMSKKTKARFMSLNAVMAKVSDIRESIQTAQSERETGRRSILFIDEIHRFNKAQQDALLPSVENGTITLIGATTENPFFSVNPSIISRAQVFELNPLKRDDLNALLSRSFDNPFARHLENLPDEYKQELISQSQGDARKLINLVELLASITDSHHLPNSMSDFKEMIQQKGVTHSESDHYDLISAYIKSIRGSDPDAAVYWLARLLKGGEDPRFIARRLMILASEDIGNADPQAMVMASSLMMIVEKVGMPEAQINLAQVTTYCATAPKSNASYKAILEANKCIESGSVYEVPKHLKDNHYSGAKKLGHGEGYEYSHNTEDGIGSQEYLPNKHSFYTP